MRVLHKIGLFGQGHALGLSQLKLLVAKHNILQTKSNTFTCSCWHLGTNNTLTEVTTPLGCSLVKSWNIMISHGAIQAMI